MKILQQIKKKIYSCFMNNGPSLILYQLTLADVVRLVRIFNIF